MTNSGSRDPQDGNDPRPIDPLRIGDGLVEQEDQSPVHAEHRTVTADSDVGTLDTSVPVPEDGDDKRHRILGTSGLEGDLLDH